MRDPDDTRAVLRLRLRANGYHPLPCEGKAPPLRGWQTRFDVTEAEIRLWDQSWHLATNTGLLTKFTPCIDIDITDQAAAEAVEALAREHFEQRGPVLVRVGQAPKRAVLLRTDEPFAKLTRIFTAPNGGEHKIEVLADGQQVVAFGIHPTTRQPYRWHGGSPADVARDELPYAREADVAAFLDDAATLLVEQFNFTDKGGGRRKAEAPKDGEPREHGDPFDWGAAFARINAGTNLHDTITALAASFVAAGMSDAAAIERLRSMLTASQAPKDARWRDRYNEIPAAVRSARAKFGEAAQARQPLSYVAMGGWDADDPPPRRWAVQDRMPIRQPTLFSGEGATGKTIIELQLCVAHVLGRDWFGSKAEPGPAIYLGCEDDIDELRRRLTDIARHYGTTFADLTRSGLHIISLVGEDALLGAPDRSGKIVPTPLYQRLIEAARDIRPKHIGIDTSADVYGGNEIDRGQVRQFVGLLRRIAIVADGGLNLLSHPSLTGISSGSGLSGSTAWHNSVRARMYLRAPLAAEGEQPDSDLRELQFLKNNYGRLAEKIVLRYRNGVFVAEPTMSVVDRAEREQAIEAIFLATLAKLVAQGRTVSPSPHAANCAAAVIASHPDGKGHTRKDYQAATERLLNKNKIHVAERGPPSRRAECIGLGPAPVNHEGQP